MNKKSDILSIIKYEGKYYAYLPSIKNISIRFKICKWWGCFDDINECFNILIQKEKEYNTHMCIDINLLRKMKINNILNDK